MLRQVTAKKVVHGKIVGLWSQRPDDNNLQYAALEDIYKFAVRNRDDIKSCKMDATESSQYGIVTQDGFMIISISEQDGKYDVDHTDGDNMQDVLNGLPTKD